MNITKTSKNNLKEIDLISNKEINLISKKKKNIKTYKYYILLIIKERYTNHFW